jgi:hypothetical protein
MVFLERDALGFSFPEIHPEATLRIEFQRTLRIPDDNREHPLPPGLGEFPLLHVDDYAARVPEQWVRRGGVFLPMYQAEALWIWFNAHDYPFAVKIAAGKINAVSGEGWRDALSVSPQDYAVAPGQPWLDGFSVDKTHIRQFVAMPLGKGYTAEEQLTGEARFGGLQIIAYPMKRERYEALLRERKGRAKFMVGAAIVCESRSLGGPEMGLAPGGLMRQSIYEDPYGLDAWDTSVHSRCYVHLLNSLQYASVTGRRPPTTPPSAKEYTAAGLPWFDYYDSDLKALAGSKLLAGLDSVAAAGVKKGEAPLPENPPVTPGKVIVLGPTLSGMVRDGGW